MAAPHFGAVLLVQAGCTMPKERVAVKHCEENILGGFEKPNLTICYNNYQGIPAELRNTILHELVHAYDCCRSNIDFFNCKHVACTEVCTALCHAVSRLFDSERLCHVEGQAVLLA